VLHCVIRDMDTSKVSLMWMKTSHISLVSSQFACYTGKQAIHETTIHSLFSKILQGDVVIVYFSNVTDCPSTECATSGHCKTFYSVLFIHLVQIRPTAYMAPYWFQGHKNRPTPFPSPML